MPTIPITSLADPRVAVYANMRDAELAQRADPLDARAHGGVFIAEGDLVVRRLVQSGYPVVSMLTTPARHAGLGEVLEGLDGEVPVYLASQEVLNGIVGFNMHRGLLAVGARGEGLSVDEVVARAGPLLVLEDINNNDNLGGIFRNAAALGGPGCGVLLSPGCADPLYRKSLRVSMGLVLDVPFARSTDLLTDVLGLQDAGFEVWGLTPRDGAEEIGALAAGLTEGRRMALVLGAEGPGLTDACLAACQRRATIEMDPAGREVDSLNVAVAAGIALYMLREGSGFRGARGTIPGSGGI